MSLQAQTLLASIPSPSISKFEIGPLTVHFYALCILAGIVIAVIMTNHRLTKKGGEPWVILDVALLAVPLAIVCARIYHVLTHPHDYFGAGTNTWNISEPGSVWAIWEGGIAIFGALIGGGIGVWVMCRAKGLSFAAVADALVPGLILAQACGRFGNWFNQELFGRETTLPWGLEIDRPNAAIPAGTPADALFQPTFLYEVIWNGLGCLVLIWLGRKAFFGWGRLLGLYLIWYGAGRTVWENIRIDPSEVIYGLRSNVWAAIFAIIVGLLIIAFQWKRHPYAQTSVYLDGHHWDAEATVPDGAGQQGADGADGAADEVDKAGKAGGPGAEGDGDAEAEHAASGTESTDEK
jgi:prolipoprotein diacylglyceryl transferase